jgi:hypothetical protein
LTKKPTSEPDMFYYGKLVSGLEKHMSKSFGIDIAADINGNPLRILCWIWKKKKYKISNKAIERAIFYYVRNVLS